MNKKKQKKSEKTTESFYVDKDQITNTKEVSSETVLPSETSEGTMNCSHAQVALMDQQKKEIAKLANDLKV